MPADSPPATLARKKPKRPPGCKRFEQATTLDAILTRQTLVTRLEVEAGCYAVLRVPGLQPKEKTALDLLRGGASTPMRCASCTTANECWPSLNRGRALPPKDDGTRPYVVTGRTRAGRHPASSRDGTIGDMNAIAALATLQRSSWRGPESSSASWRSRWIT
jgi:LSD1 subclass zinc finger protein